MVAGFAGATADAFTLLERFEATLRLAVLLHTFLAHHLQVPHESFRTSELGDELDKFVRLYHPHTALDLGPRRPPPQPRGVDLFNQLMFGSKSGQVWT